MGLPGVAFGQSGLDLSSDKVPKGFKGDDIIKVFKALENSPQKEDTDRTYIFKLNDDNVLSSPAGVWIQEYTEGIPTQYERKYQARLPSLSTPEDFYLIKDMGSKVKKWTGQNVFGARVRAETTTEVKYFVVPAYGNIGKLPGIPEGGKIGVLFIGKPYNKGNRYAFSLGSGLAATFDHPYGISRKLYSVRLDIEEVWVYNQNSGKVLLKQKVPDIPTGKKINYSSKIDELHNKMKSELDRLGQLVRSDPQKAVAVSVGPMSKIENLIKERDNLKIEALKYYHSNLPPDLAEKFKESERRTDYVRKTMRDAGARW